VGNPEVGEIRRRSAGDYVERGKQGMGRLFERAPGNAGGRSLNVLHRED